MTNSGSEPSATVARFAEQLQYSDIPDQAIELVNLSIIDTIGVMVAGLNREPAQIVARVLSVGSSGGTIGVIGGGVTASPTDAAFIHGTAGHVLDFDDSSAGMNGHPSVTMVPALLSIADIREVTGEEFITAYVAGFETQCSIAAPILESHYRLGWHPTSTLGTLGTAIASGKLLDLSTSQLRHSLNIATSMASGLKQNFGSMTKPLHVGHAARAGLTAALLAKEGFTADLAALGSSQGFWNLYSDGVDSESTSISVPPQDQWSILQFGINLKKYPCCHFTHGAIAAIIDLTELHDIVPSEVEHVRIEASQGAEDAAGISNPMSELEGRFSMVYLAAAALTTRSITFSTFTNERLENETIREVMEKVEFVVDETRSYGSLASNVQIKTDDGRIYKMNDSIPPGMYRNPLSQSEVHDKFTMCLTQNLTKRSAEDSWVALSILDEVEDVAEALAPLR